MNKFNRVTKVLTAVLLVMSGILAGSENKSNTDDPAEKIVIIDSSDGMMELQSYFGRLFAENDPGAIPDMDVEIKTVSEAWNEQLKNGQVVAFTGKKMFDSRTCAIYTYALMPLLIAVPEKSPVGNVTIGELRRIYSGKINSWNRLTDAAGKNDIPGAVKRVGFSSENAVGKAFAELVMKEASAGKPAKYELAPDIVNIRTAQAAEILLQAWPGAVVFGGEALRNIRQIKLLKVNNAEPTPENIRSGRYPLVIPHSLLYLRTQPAASLQSTVSFLQKSALATGNFIAPDPQK